MRKQLKDAQVGDKAIIRYGKGKAKLVTVKRLNPKSLTTDDGKRWDYSNCREIGDPGYGMSTILEIWDDEFHPYLADANLAKTLLEDLYRANLTPKQLAAILPALREVQSARNREQS